ncbi:TIR domain-containing protein [Lentzea terrae]|uniref:TIR domain-containing protein n=1 Tax=Lentzea terrae TaxID=2200761 RepID=UPI000DD4859E|nr:TIR domain-containing protein [Lentzea terrae]
MADEKAFAAFISYSHATDHELGPLLQEGIEKFAKPWYRPRARRVFLDNSVLAAESDLTQAILDGLSSAENFLLLASPASARSRWVAEEVAWWLENRDRRSLFVLLTDGEAVWDNGVLDQERTNALPQALHDIPEPRCVDLRGVRHDPRDPGWESVLADVVAPLDGIEKSELIGHHIRERRRTKRTVVATISVLTVLLVAAVIFAVRSEQQSDRAQQQTLVATSRQLVAQAAAIRDSRPNIARQLLAQAYRMSPTAEVLGALMESPSIPRVVPTGGTVRALAFAPSGETFVAARDNDLVVYEGTTEWKRIPLGAQIRDVAFHPDGKHVVAGTEHTTIIVDIAAPAKQHVRPSGADSLAFAPGKPVVAAGSTLLDLTEPLAPKEIVRIGRPGDTAISADGNTIAVAVGGSTIELWDVSGKLRGTLTARGEAVSTMRFAPRGSVLAVTTADQTVQLWNATNLELYSVLTGADLHVQALAFAQDASMLAVGDITGGVDLWDVTDLVQPRAGPSLPGHIGGVQALAFRADSRVLASAAVDGSPQQDVVRLWQVLAGARSAAVSVVPAGGNELAFGVNRLLATGRPTTLYDLSDAANPRTVRTLRTFNVVGQPIAFSPDGTRLAAGLPIVLMDPASADPPAVKQEKGTYRVVFSPDGRLIGAKDIDGVTLWTRQGDHAVQASKLPDTAGAAAQGIAFSQDSRSAVTVGANGQSVQLWDIGDPAGPRPARTMDTKDDPVVSVLFGPGPDHVVAGHHSGVISVWNVDGSRVTSVSLHLGRVHNLAMHPDGRTLASAGAAGEVALWDVTDPSRPLGVSQLTSGHTFDDASIAFSPDGTLLGGADGTRTTIWSIDVPQLLARLCADSPRIPETEWRQYLPDIPYDPPCA